MIYQILFTEAALKDIEHLKKRGDNAVLKK